MRPRDLWTCSDNLYLQVRSKEPAKGVTVGGKKLGKLESCFMPHVQWMREEEQKTGKTPSVLVFLFAKKGTEDVSQQLDKIFNEDDEQPDQRKITVSMRRISNAVVAAAPGGS